MGIITGLLSLLGSTPVGAIIGGVFALINKKTDIDVKRLEFEQERAKWEHEVVLRDKDIALTQAEAQARKDVAIIEGDASIETSRMVAIAAAQTADQTSADEISAAGKLGWLLVITEAARKFVRPALTFLLVGCALYLNNILIGRLTDDWASLTTAQRYDFAMQALSWVIGQASVVLSYWFVSRGSSK